MASENVNEVLARQLVMNEQSWRALREHGVTEQSQLRLDFFFVAPGQGEAERLRAFIYDETDYDVQAASSKVGVLRKKAWSVTGTTQPTGVSLDVLNDWVRWMVAAGHQHGCEFDGWGAEAG